MQLIIKTKTQTIVSISITQSHKVVSISQNNGLAFILSVNNEGIMSLRILSSYICMLYYRFQVEGNQPGMAQSSLKL